MNDLMKNLTLLRSEKLTADERALMRAKLVANVEAYALRTAGRNHSLFGVSMRQYKRAVGFAVIAFFAASTGASYAAASSLPGDILYPIKIHVKERIEGAIAMSPKASAEFAQKQINRRAVEAETLVQQNRFDETKKEQLAEETKIHVDAYAEARTKIENKGSRADVEELEDNMHRTIRTHEHVFSDMGIVTVGTSTDEHESTTTDLRGSHDRRVEFITRPLRRSIPVGESSVVRSRDVTNNNEEINASRQQDEKSTPARENRENNESIRHHDEVKSEVKTETSVSQEQKESRENSPE